MRSKGKGNLYIEVGLINYEGEFVKDGRLYDLSNDCSLPESLSGLKTILQSLPEQSWVELDIDFDVDVFYESGDYSTPPYYEDERNIRSVMAGYMVEGKLQRMLIPNDNDLYQTLQNHYRIQIEEKEFQSEIDED